MLGSKKGVVLVFVSLMFLSLFAFVVSAQIGSPSPGSSSASTTNSVNDFFKGLGSDLKEWFSNFADFRGNNKLITILLYFLVFMVIASIVNMIPLFNKRNKVFQFFVALVVTTLSMILIPYEVLRLAVNPYSALGVVIITIMPFVFMMFFVYSTLRNVFLRHAAWAIFTFALIILGIYTLNTGDLNSKPNWYSYIYFLGAIGTAIMLWWGEELERSILKGKIKAAGNSAQDYLNMRKLQMEFDDKRSEVELGVKSSRQSKRLGP